MTATALTLLRQCAIYAVPMRSTDVRWEAAMELINRRLVRVDWSMRGFSALRAVRR